jgi:molecular chaperone HscB
MTDPFALLGVPAQYDLDLADLHRRFIALASANHPDRFLDPGDQADAAERAAQINQAYRVLADPQSRAEALLSLLAGPAQAPDHSLPPDLLTTMLDVREELEQARAANDSRTLARLRTWALEQHNAYLARIAALFALAADPHQQASAVKDIRLVLNALRYFQRMLEQLPSA